MFHYYFSIKKVMKQDKEGKNKKMTREEWLKERKKGIGRFGCCSCYWKESL